MLNFTNKEFEAERELKPFGWHCIHADKPSCALNILNQYDIKIAIALISKKQIKKVLSSINQLNDCQDDLLWIAILTDTSIADVKLTNCLSRYFSDYHHLPIDWERLQHTLGHAYGMAQLKTMHQAAELTANTSDEILGESTIIKQLKSKISKIAQADEAVLISGETGTGKGLCAHLIHRQSSRHNGPFITINCGALSASLINSELFGHEKGAFTGADKQYIGHIERAHNGSLFLDEIGDLSLESQVHLLQFLDEHIIERVGGSEIININCRIILASHINLDTAVEEGRFREDLYHRVNILHLHVPSLREHKEDIPLLAAKYLHQYSPSQQISALTARALEVMCGYEWPGNVRELKNRIRRAIIMANNQQLTDADLGLQAAVIHQDNSGKVNLAQHRVDIDTELLLDAIKRNNHNMSAAARELKISRTTLYRLIKKCQIKL
ncbi:sigma-54 dependent transcriptional regulator [Shewanella sp. UCD-KL21]|uniref:sigma-54 dependent transcriptional regulator n=1 Tax=Shewanella sp. UCD-KL21 TaxID=1917164 RepID=UPI0020C95873|nr:sigma-54 dependent transcriptional regulator [Shewanella sp. UCD-KL21]